MRVASPLVLVSALLFLAPAATAEAQDYESSLQRNCTPTACAVAVIVPPGCGGGITVRPDPIVVRAGDSVTIRWTITGDWDFADAHGIFIYQGTEKVFREFARSGDGKNFAVAFQRAQRGSYKYDINLKKGSLSCRLDPVIVNW